MVCKRCIWVAGAVLLCTSVLVAGVSAIQPTIDGTETKAPPVRAESLADALTGSSNTVTLDKMETTVAPNAVSEPVTPGPQNTEAPVAAPMTSDVSKAPVTANAQRVDKSVAVKSSLALPQGTEFTGPPTPVLRDAGTECPVDALYSAPP